MFELIMTRSTSKLQKLAWKYNSETNQYIVNLQPLLMGVVRYEKNKTGQQVWKGEVMGAVCLEIHDEFSTWEEAKEYVWALMQSMVLTAGQGLFENEKILQPLN